MSTVDISSLLTEISAGVSSHFRADSGSDKQRLLDNISKLQRAIETPQQYVQRLRMQVGRFVLCLCCRSLNEF